MMQGKFCHSCFEITARTALAQFGHFTLKTRVWFQKGCDPQAPCVLHCWQGCPTFKRQTDGRLLFKLAAFYSTSVAFL